MPAKTGRQQVRDAHGRFLPGNSGNPGGRPMGSRHRATMAAQVLLDGEAEALTHKAVELALGGDTTALRLCLERLVPPRKDSPVNVEFPPITGPQDAVKALSTLLEAVGRGELTPTEAQAVARLLESYRRALEVEELERRIIALEQEKNR